MEPPGDYWKCAECNTNLPSITDVKTKWLEIAGGRFPFSLCKKCIKKKKLPKTKKS